MSEFTFKNIVMAMETRVAADPSFKVIDGAHYKNGTGYFDNLTKEDVGDHIQLMICSETGRKGIIIPFAPGRNVVIFQRYAEGQGGVLVMNAFNPLVKQVFPDLQNAVNGEVLEDLIGYVDDIILSKLGKENVVSNVNKMISACN